MAQSVKPLGGPTALVSTRRVRNPFEHRQMDPREPDEAALPLEIWKSSGRKLCIPFGVPSANKLQDDGEPNTHTHTHTEMRAHGRTNTHRSGSSVWRSKAFFLPVASPRGRCFLIDNPSFRKIPSGNGSYSYTLLIHRVHSLANRGERGNMGQWDKIRYFRSVLR